MSATKRTGIFSSSDSDGSEDEALGFKRKKTNSSSAKSISSSRYISKPNFNTRSTRTLSSTLNSGNDSDDLTVASSVRNIHLKKDPIDLPSGIGNLIQNDDNVDSIKVGTIKTSTNGEKALIRLASVTEPSAIDIMAQMGFEKGKGMAKFSKFMINAAKNRPTLEQLNARVIQLGIVELTDEELSSIEDAEIKLEEEVTWIQPEVPKSISITEMLGWRKIGYLDEKVGKPDKHQLFIHPVVLKELINCKKLFSEWDENYYQAIRYRANPYEKISKGPFICRAAMKMANIDATLGFGLTEPKGQCGGNALRHDELFYFADVCAGPGGFTEYILWRKKWEAKGFGMTLKGDLDFDLNNFSAGEPESFEPFYGPAGDGNIYNPENVVAYMNHVLNFTEGKGVHLMMADGGFSVSKQENMQEILSAQIYLSQCMVALGIIRIGGHFVCKLFDIITPFSVGLIYLMYISFDLVTIHKPNTSRPANSERYLICKWKREKTDNAFKYLIDCHRKLWEFTKPGFEGDVKHILDLVPIQILTLGDHPFFKFIWESNNDIAKRQIQSIKEMIPYARDSSLTNDKQEETTQKLFELWKVPENIVKSEKKNTCTVGNEILNGYPHSMIQHRERFLNAENMEANFLSPYDWRIVVVEARANDLNRGFYLSMGRHMIYRYFGQQWVFADLDNQVLELPEKTLIYGEVVNEIYGTRPNQSVIKTFHIIDGLMLGGKDIRSWHYTQRHEICVKFAKALNKIGPGKLPVKVKNPVRMENVADVIDKLSNRMVKGVGVGAKLVCPIDHTDETSPVIIPSGLLFLKITKDPWQMALNREAKCKYWFDRETGAKRTNVPPLAVADFFWTMNNRVFWSWDKGTNTTLLSLESTDPRVNVMDRSKIHSFSLINYVNMSLRLSPTIITSTPTPTSPITSTSNDIKHSPTTAIPSTATTSSPRI